MEVGCGWGVCVGAVSCEASLAPGGLCPILYRPHLPLEVVIHIVGGQLKLPGGVKGSVLRGACRRAATDCSGQQADRRCL